VLVDGGTPVSDLSKEAAAAAHAFLVGPALARHAMSFMSAQAYLEFWRQHPAFAHAWNEDVEVYVLHDLSGKPGNLRYAVNAQALETDSDNMLSDRENRNAIVQVRTPLHLLRSLRGALGDKNLLIQQRELDAFVAYHPTAKVEDVNGVNHYTIVLGDSPGPPRIAAAIEAAAKAATSA
jgi:hypothetical protein